jgi:hypothetical protein
VLTQPGWGRGGQGGTKAKVPTVMAAGVRNTNTEKMSRSL